jgi:hypothetical protein
MICKTVPKNDCEKKDVEDGAEDNDGQVEAEKEVKSVVRHLRMPLEQPD